MNKKREAQSPRIAHHANSRMRSFSWPQTNMMKNKTFKNKETSLPYNPSLALATFLSCLNAARIGVIPKRFGDGERRIPRIDVFVHVVKHQPARRVLRVGPSPCLVALKAVVYGLHLNRPTVLFVHSLFCGIMRRCADR